MGRARTILEDLCQRGDNVWQTGMLSLYAVSIGKVLEAWSQERKSEIIRKNAARGLVLLDHAVLDDYDLALWRVPVDLDFAPTGILHAVSINSEEHDPTERDVQMVKFPGSSLRHLPVASISDILRGWIRDYGKLAIGTAELRKLNIYRRLLLKQGFTITDMSGNPDRGFYVE